MKTTVKAGKGVVKQKHGSPVLTFESLKDESAFWDTHSPLEVGEWEVVPHEAVCQELGARRETKLPVTLRLERALIERLKDAARRHGIKYQALAREILWRSLAMKAKQE